MITNTKEVANICNTYNTNIVEISSGKLPTSVTNKMTVGALSTDIIDAIVLEYTQHPSIEAIEKQNTQNIQFSFTEVTVDEIRKLLVDIDHTKSTGE